MAAVIWSIGKLVLLTALAAEAVTRLGAGFLDWGQQGVLTRVERFGAGFLLGIGVLGTAYLGLAITGLFYPATLVVVLALLVAAARGGWSKSSLVVSALTAWCRAAGSPGIWLVAVALVPSLIHLVMPDLNQDVWLYHFGAPWQTLQLHRLPLAMVPLTYHLPLPVEMTFALGFVAGDDRLAKGIQLVSFAAAAAAWSGGGRTGPSLWIAPILALATGYMELSLGCGKNDLAAAAMLVAGAGLARRRAFGAGAWLMGFSAAAKLVYLPMSGLWMLVHRPAFRRWGWFAFAFALPTAGWAAKEWLATGHPTAPFVAPGILPAFDWGVLNEQTFRIYAKGTLLTDAQNADLPGTWLYFMKVDHMAMLLLLPGLLLLGRPGTRLEAAACIGALLVALVAGHHPRYMLAAAWTLVTVAGAEAGMLPAVARRLAAPLFAAAVVARIGMSTDVWHVPKRETLLPKYTTTWSTTFGQAADWLARIGARRTLSVGELRTYLLPGRMVYSGVNGEMPLMWQCAAESPTAERIRIRVRQFGVTNLLYNYISADWLANRYLPFAWTPRMIGIYREYALTHLELIGTSDGNDFGNGGFCLFRVNARTMQPRQKFILFLPGTEALFGESIALESLGRPKEAMESVKRILALMPDVAHAWNAMGHAYAVLGDAPKAYDHLIKFGTMMDQLNVPELAWAALRVGRVDMAEQLLQFSLTRYPDQLGTIHVNLAQVREQRASFMLNAQKPKEAAVFIADAEAHMALVPVDPPNHALKDSRRLVAATLWALKGQYNIEIGDNTNAVACLRQALNLSPDDVMAPRWKSAIKALPMQFSSLGQ